MKFLKDLTLIEWCIIAAILGILAAIIAPKAHQMWAEAYKTEHGSYPAGYDPIPRSILTPPESETSTIQELGGQDIHYIYDSRTELCFAYYYPIGHDSMVVVPCDKVVPLLSKPAKGF